MAAPRWTTLCPRRPQDRLLCQTAKRDQRGAEWICSHCGPQWPAHCASQSPMAPSDEKHVANRTRTPHDVGRNGCVAFLFPPRPGRGDRRLHHHAKDRLGGDDSPAALRITSPCQPGAAHRLVGYWSRPALRHPSRWTRVPVLSYPAAPYRYGRDALCIRFLRRPRRRVGRVSHPGNRQSGYPVQQHGGRRQRQLASAE